MNTTIGAPSANVPLLLEDVASLAATDREKRLEALRHAHLAVGVDPRYLSLPPRHRLWSFQLQVEAAATATRQATASRQLEYASGVSKADALLALRRYFTTIAPGAEFDVLQVRESTVERPEELSFPDQVRRADMPAVPLMRGLSS